MITKDHLGKALKLKVPAKRIVCLAPSITELLFDLGLIDKLVGRTKFCIYPEGGFTNAKIIGGTKNVHIEKVKDLNPDLVIANKEENVKEQVEQISLFTNTFTTVIKNKEDALKMIVDIGQLTGSDIPAQNIINQIKTNDSIIEKTDKISMAYLIWKEPFMTVGGDTFISNYMKEFGFHNCFETENRYPQISIEEIKLKNPDVILLSSEPFPFSNEHLEEIQKLTNIRTELIDGSYCSWYGSRMIEAGKYLRHMRNKLP